MNASIPGSKDWWTVVLSMPNSEALQNLHAYKNQLIEENIGRSTANASAGVISKCNVEIKRINLRNDDARWYNACRDVLTPELFDEVLTRKRLMEQAA